MADVQTNTQTTSTVQTNVPSLHENDATRDASASSPAKPAVVTNTDPCAEETRRKRAAYLLQINYDRRKLPKTLREEFKDCYQSDVQVFEDLSAAKQMSSAPASPPVESSDALAPQPERTLSPQEKEVLTKLVREWAHKGARLEFDYFPADELTQFGTRNVSQEIEAFWMSGKPGANGDRYFEFDDGLFKGTWKTSKGGFQFRELERMTNFKVETIRKVIYDDGVSEEVTFEIDVYFNGNKYRQKSLQNADFHKMEWPMYLIDTSAIRFPRDAHETQVAIQATAQHLPPRRVHTHTGWIEQRSYVGSDDYETEYFYLHANGAIGAKGTRSDLKAEPRSKKVRQIALPEPPTGEALKNAIRASLKFLDVGPPTITMVLYAAIFRAPLPDAAITIWGLGPTGVLKTSTFLVTLQFYGAGFDEKALSSWEDTRNAAMDILSEPKDALWLVDDFNPDGTERDRQDKNKMADTLIRGTANQTGRSRLNRNGTPRSDRPPRALLLATGEDRPSGHSKAARTIYSRFTKAAINLTRLTAAQKDAKAGIYASVMAGYLKWLASQYATLKDHVEKRIAELRPLFELADRHGRTAENLASLAVGFEMFLAFAKSAQAVSQSEANELWKSFVETMKRVGSDQDELQKTEDPITESIRILKEAYESGQVYLEYAKLELNRAHEADALAVELKVEHRPGSIEIGQLDDDGSWMCLPDMLYAALQKLYGRINREFPKSKDEYLQELKARGLTDTEDGRTTKKAPRHWRSATDVRPRVVYFPAQVFEDAEEDIIEE